MVKNILNQLKEKLLPTPVIPNMVHVDRAPHAHWDKFPIGVKVKDEVVFWEPATNPHMLLTGAAGTGKTMLIRNLVAHCLIHSDRWGVAGVDMNHGELTELNKHDDPNIYAVANNLEDGLEACKVMHEEMFARYERLEAEGFNNINDLKAGDKNILFIIDAAATFLTPSGANTPEEKKNDEMREDAAQLIENLARLGRAAGIFVVIATQRPDRSIVSGEAWANLSMKIVLGKVSNIHSALALGTEAATEIDGAVKGRGYYHASYGEGEGEFQSYYVDRGWVENKINATPAGLDASGNAVYWDPSEGK